MISLLWCKIEIVWNRLWKTGKITIEFKINYRFTKFKYEIVEK